jgi:hypothetical protein
MTDKPTPVRDQADDDQQVLLAKVADLDTRLAATEEKLNSIAGFILATLTCPALH